MQAEDLKGEQRPINWRVGKQRFGNIRRNQVWMKRDTGKRMTILSARPNNSWHVRFEGDSRGMRTHALKERDIFRFYILIEK